MDKISNLNLTALTIGIIIAIVVIIWFRKTKLEREVWVYPLLIATFPVYYWVFAVYGSDMQALYKELLVGVIYIVLVYVALKVKRNFGLVLLATACISHAAYDMFHDSLFTNSGTPLWWPEFCGSVDILIGFYLLYRVVSFSVDHTKSVIN